MRRGAAGFVAVAGVMVFGLANAALLAQASATAQTSVAQATDATQAKPAQAAAVAQGIAGTWQGTMAAGKGPRIMVRIRAGKGGAWLGEAYRLDEDEAGRTLSAVSLQGGVLSFAVHSIDVQYTGKLSADGALIEGAWVEQGHRSALNLTRATSETEWKAESLKMMAKDADPSFEVATIKPSKPEDKSQGFHLGDGRRVNCNNETMNDMLAVVYGLHAKQIVGAPAWFGTDRWDVDGFPDVPGVPDADQMRAMYRRLLEERFALKTHMEKKELSAFAIQVKGEPKLAKSLDQNGLSDTTFTEYNSRRRILRVTSTSMDEFRVIIQDEANRPVVNQTGLTEKWDFLLKWSPDDAPTSEANALPELFTAMQEQLGLKLVPVKAPVDVIVIDHVERPSAN
jgi:uncharacterized protein (TIGR03435 family)